MTVLTISPGNVDTTSIWDEELQEDALGSPYLPANDNGDGLEGATATATEITKTFGFLPQPDIPTWVDFADDLVTFYVITNELYRPLLSVFSIIQTVFKGTCKVNITLNTKSEEYGQDLLVVSITGTKSQNKNMAEYLMQCNYEMARSLPVDVLPLIVLAMD